MSRIVPDVLVLGEIEGRAGEHAHVHDLGLPGDAEQLGAVR